MGETLMTAMLGKLKFCMDMVGANIMYLQRDSLGQCFGWYTDYNYSDLKYVI